MKIEWSAQRLLLASCALLIAVNGATGLTRDTVRETSRFRRSGIVKSVKTRPAEPYDRVASWGKLVGGSILLIVAFPKIQRSARNSKD